jgi:hypothetical protein
MESVWHRIQAASTLSMWFAWGTVAFGFFADLQTTKWSWVAEEHMNLLMTSSYVLDLVGGCCAIAYAIIGARKVSTFVSAAGALAANALSLMAGFGWVLASP